MQNEDDASVALHVSNALTQALLQYRMVNVQEEVSISRSLNFSRAFCFHDLKLAKMALASAAQLLKINKMPAGH